MSRYKRWSTPLRCIDVSRYQTAFDATTCKAAGVSVIMGRLAYGTSPDSKAFSYLALAKSVGLSVGGYGFGTWHYKSKNGDSVDEARVLMWKQVNYWIERAKSAGCDSWVVIDQELEKDQKMGLSKADNTALLIEAASLIKTAGFSPCLYASASWISSNVDLTRFTFPLWVAYYKWYGTAKDFDEVETFPSKGSTYSNWMIQHQDQICMWQFTSEGYASKYGCTHASDALDKNWIYFSPAGTDTGNETVAYFAKYTGSSISIVNALAAIGEQSSFAYRGKIAAANGITGYIGLPSQNLKMLSLLKSGELIKP